jgi:hypothetical protein
MTMTPETAAKVPGKRARNASDALSPATSLCLCGCGKSFIQTRTWHVYYSTACKKRGNAQNARRTVPSDVRATLTRIELAIRAVVDANLAARIAVLEIKLDGIIKSMEGKS